MPKSVLLFVVGGLLFGSIATSVLAQGLKETETLAKQIKEILNANSMLGTPLDIEGTKIIPIASILFGFGAGSGSSEEETGTGGGGGGSVMPVGFLVIRPDGTIQVIEAQKSTLSEIAKAIVPVIMESMAGRKGEAEKAGEPESVPAEPEEPTPQQ